MKKFIAVALGLGILSGAAMAQEKPRKEGERKRPAPTKEQKELRAAMVKKYDANKDGKLDREERGKISAEDREKMSKAFGRRGRRGPNERGDGKPGERRRRGDRDGKDKGEDKDSK